jgi:ribosomal protein L7Ae-like RNA K-turn-binding protein
MNKIRSYLGLCMRAGKLISGDEGVLKAIRSGEAKLVIIAEDASSNAVKKFSDKCRSYQVPIIQHCTREDLGGSIGRENRIIVAITDQGFVRMIQRALENQTEV